MSKAHDHRRKKNYVSVYRPRRRDGVQVYHVTISESLAKTIEIEAKSAEEAEKLADEGSWYDDWVVKERVVDRIVVDSEEVKMASLHFSMINCERCGSNEFKYYSMSFLNTQMCCDECLEKETKHPQYREAKEEEHRQVKSGNYNYSPNITVDD